MKRLLCCLSIVVLVLVMISPAAYAANREDIYAQVATANQAIEARITTAQQDADQLLAQADFLYNLAFTGWQRTAIEKLTDARLDNIITNLIRDTDRIAAITIEAAARVGVKVVCTYVEVEVGGRTVWVDPLVICNE